jgi:hypothetical protein
MPMALETEALMLMPLRQLVAMAQRLARLVLDSTSLLV